MAYKRKTTKTGPNSRRSTTYNTNGSTTFSNSTTHAGTTYTNKSKNGKYTITRTTRNADGSVSREQVYNSASQPNTKKNSSSYSLKTCVVCNRKKPANEMKKVSTRYACNGWLDTCAQDFMKPKITQNVAFKNIDHKAPKVVEHQERCKSCGKMKPVKSMRAIDGGYACDGLFQLCAARIAQAIADRIKATCLVCGKEKPLRKMKAVSPDSYACNGLFSSCTRKAAQLI